MPAYSYVVDGYYQDVWPLSGVDKHGAPLYLRADAVVGSDDVIGPPVRPWTQTAIEDTYGVSGHGPEVYPVHTPQRDADEARTREYERTHPFVNVP